LLLWVKIVISLLIINILADISHDLLSGFVLVLALRCGLARGGGRTDGERIASRSMIVVALKLLICISSREGRRSEVEGR
jgi:hypothetical protein